MVDPYTNYTLVRARMAEDARRAAHHGLRRQQTAGGRRFLVRVLVGATDRLAITRRPSHAEFELDRAT